MVGQRSRQAQHALRAKRTHHVPQQHAAVCVVTPAQLLLLISSCWLAGPGVAHARRYFTPPQGLEAFTSLEKLSLASLNLKSLEGLSTLTQVAARVNVVPSRCC